MLLARALWPANESPDVSAGPWFNVRSVRDARGEHGKRNVIAAIDRQLGNLPLGNHRGHDGPLDVDERQRRDDIDGLGARRQLQRHAEFDGGAQLDRDVVDASPA